MRSHLLTIGLALASATAGAAAFAQLDEQSTQGRHLDTKELQQTPIGLAVTVRPTHGYPIRGTMIDFSRDWITLRDDEDRTYWIPRDTVWYVETRVEKASDDSVSRELP